ncbi:MAG: cytochrome b/b6 domain-containing protein [Pseudomonadota bacterium]
MQTDLAINAASDPSSPAAHGSAALTRIRLWDLPLRIFHWSLAVAVSTAIVTGEIGASQMALHAKAGMTIIGLLVFRLIWGVIGSTHARFLSFVPSPSTVKSYLKGHWRGVGHNPLGALSVFALLGLLAVQAGTGLFSNDDIDFFGPLFNLVDQAWSNRLTGVHMLLSYFLLALTALHIVAILFYVSFKKDNLIKPMLTGWKEVPSGKSASKVNLVGFVVAVLLALAAVYIVSGANWWQTPPAQAAQPASQSSTW